jgi:uncharacterized protein YecT (DUF1311 family)
MKKNFIIVSILLFSTISSAVANPTNTQPLSGTWQISGYQVVGYPAMSTAEIKSWVGKIVRFTTQKKAILHDKKENQPCPQFDYQVTFENAESYFQIGFSVKPHRLGIVEEDIQLVTLTCQVDSWFGKTRQFVMVGEEQMLSYWEGVIFFFARQSNTATIQSIQSRSKTLLITPQSVGLLNPDSDFNQKTLTQALPNYQLEKNTQIGNAGKPVIESYELYQDDELRLQVYPDPVRQKIASIHIFDEKALAPGQAKLGAIYTEVFKNDEELVDCQAGVGERAGKTLCSFKNMSSIQYVFKPKTDKGSLISPIEALNQAELVELVWTADRNLINEPLERGKVQGERENQIGILSSSTNKQENSITVLIDAQSNYQIQEKRLDEIYKRLNLVLSPKNMQEKEMGENTEFLDFAKVQTAWQKYRDDNCSWQSIIKDDDKEQPYQNFACLERMTRERANVLEEALNRLEKK